MIIIKFLKPNIHKVSIFFILIFIAFFVFSSSINLDNEQLSLIKKNIFFIIFWSFYLFTYLSVGGVWFYLVINVIYLYLLSSILFYLIHYINIIISKKKISNKWLNLKIISILKLSYFKIAICLYLYCFLGYFLFPNDFNKISIIKYIILKLFFWPNFLSNPQIGFFLSAVNTYVIICFLFFIIKKICKK